MTGGQDILKDSARNKSTAFSREEREKYKLRGLLPYAVADLETQKMRALENMRRKAYDIEKYIFLNALLERNQVLFYRALIDHIEELMPLIYTPTVGQACKEFAQIFRRAQGFYITPEDRGDIDNILGNWHEDDIRMIVVTDGERILGLGDLGASGMGIPIGKLSLYVAGAGIDPKHCLPVMLDVGTNNEEMRNDPLYLGYPKPRIVGDAYDSLVDEFIEAVQKRYPRALIQFEDFLTPNAYKLLNRYRDRVLCFNDDIQGTAAVALSGIYASSRISGTDFKDLKIMFLGAGSAATGIADLMTTAFEAEGLSNEDARRRLWFVDVNGLVVKSRTDLMPHNLPYAHEEQQIDFLTAVKRIKPHVLIGATGAPGTFTKEIIQTLADIHDRPAVFALSNPTSRAECTSEQAYEWSDGRAIFVSGSPFGPVDHNRGRFQPGQGNNAYIFPGIGLGALACKARCITDSMFLAAARSLADQVAQVQIDQGTLYPPLPELRNVSKGIARAVAKAAVQDQVADLTSVAEVEEYLATNWYDATYA